MMKKYLYLIPLLMIFIFCIQAMASQTKEIVKVSINGNESSIRVLNHDYDKNMYISMNDMSDLLKDTDKAFIVEWTSKDGQTCVVLKPGKSEDETDIDKKEEEASQEDGEDDKVNYTRKRMLINLGGNDYSFYAIPVSEKDYKDCYVNLGEFALAMNMDISCYNNSVYINTKGEFDFSKYDLLNSGLPYMADSCLVGDATTGNVYYSQNADEVVTIASTTKLMTYLIIKDAMAAI